MFGYKHVFWDFLNSKYKILKELYAINLFYNLNPEFKLVPSSNFYKIVSLK
jgi:hypothetical protein